MPLFSQWFFTLEDGKVGGKMNKRYIIKESKIFNDMISNAKKVTNQYFLIFYTKNSFPYNRYGISVGKKIGKAVTRNRLKRQTRVILAAYQKDYIFNTDCIIMVRKSCLLLSYKEMEKNLRQLLNIIKDKEKKNEK